MNDEDKVVTERMLALLERIAAGVENLSPASSYAFMEAKLPEVMNRLAPLAQKFKKRRAPVRADVLRKRMALRRRRAKKS